MAQHIRVDFDRLADGDMGTIMEFSALMVKAVKDACSVNEVTYVWIGGRLIASVTPPEAGERFEHAAGAAAVTPHEPTVPVMVRTSRRRPRWRWPGPFEGVF